MNPTDQPFINPDVIFRADFDDAAILFHPQLGEAISVSGFALDLWRALDGTRSLAEISRALSAQYDQSPEVILEDTLAFTQDLYRRMFVLTEPLAPIPEHAERPRHRIIPDDDPASAPTPIQGKPFSLTLADGSRFVLRAQDTHAERVVAFFAESARLDQTSEVLGRFPNL